MKDFTRMFSGFDFGEKQLKEGSVVDIQIMKTGKWKHPVYGEVTVTEKTLNDIKSNFDKDKRGIELAVDENHERGHKALAWFKEIYKKGAGSLFAKLELTKGGAKLLSDGAYRYFSPEYITKKVDEATGEIINNLLLGGAFTNRPFFKGMKPLMASEVADQGEDTNNLHYNFNLKMTKLEELNGLLVKFNEEGLTTEEFEKVDLIFSEELTKEEKTDELREEVDKCLYDTDKFNEDKADDKVTTDDDKDAGEGDTNEENKEDDENKEENKEDDKEEEVKEEEEKKVEANEDKAVTISASEYSEFKGMAKSLSKLTRQARKRDLSDKVKSMSFSDTNKESIVLPKSTDGIVEFALSLSETQAEKFLSIIDNLQKVSLGEIGSGKTQERKFANDDEKSDVLAREYAEKHGVSYSDAVVAITSA